MPLIGFVHLLYNFDFWDAVNSVDKLRPGGLGPCCQVHVMVANKSRIGKKTF